MAVDCVSDVCVCVEYKTQRQTCSLHGGWEDECVLLLLQSVYMYVYKHMIYISDGDWSGGNNRKLGGLGYN